MNGASSSSVSQTQSKNTPTNRTLAEIHELRARMSTTLTSLSAPALTSTISSTSSALTIAEDAASRASQARDDARSAHKAAQSALSEAKTNVITARAALETAERACRAVEAACEVAYAATQTSEDAQRRAAEALKRRARPWGCRGCFCGGVGRGEGGTAWVVPRREKAEASSRRGEVEVVSAEAL